MKSCFWTLLRNFRVSVSTSFFKLYLFWAGIVHTQMGNFNNKKELFLIAQLVYSMAYLSSGKCYSYLPKFQLNRHQQQGQPGQADYPGGDTLRPEGGQTF